MIRIYILNMGDSKSDCKSFSYKKDARCGFLYYFLMMNNEQHTETDLKPLPIDAWSDELSHIISDMKGRPINVHALMAHNPALLKAWWDFRNYSVTGGGLGKRLGEIVILRVGVHMKAWYEWASHVERALDCGMAMDEIERVKQGGDADGWSAQEACLLRAVDSLIERHAIAPEILAELNGYFSASQVMDIIAIHGMYVILGCMINTWGLDVDAHVLEALPEGVTREDFEKGFLLT